MGKAAAAGHSLRKIAHSSSTPSIPPMKKAATKGWERIISSYNTFKLRSLSPGTSSVQTTGTGVPVGGGKAPLKKEDPYKRTLSNASRHCASCTTIGVMSGWIPAISRRSVTVTATSAWTAWRTAIGSGTYVSRWRQGTPAARRIGPLFMERDPLRNQELIAPYASICSLSSWMPHYGDNIYYSFDN